MIYKRCPKCGKRIEVGIQCCKREYNKPLGVYSLYHTNRWRKLRETIMSYYDGLDQWALSHGRIEYAETVHHIVPTIDNESMFFTVGNLIPVSRRSHDEIHALYKTDKDRTQEKLKDITRSKCLSGGGGT